MITKKLDENTYEVQVYDQVELHDDYICGYIKRYPDEDEDSDLRYFMFYPIGGNKPLNVGDLRKIYEFMGNSNKNI